jgi:hypothetical protein
MINGFVFLISAIALWRCFDECDDKWNSLLLAAVASLNTYKFLAFVWNLLFHKLGLI